MSEMKENELWTMNEFTGHIIRMDKITGYFNAKDMIKVSPNKVRP